MVSVLDIKEQDTMANIGVDSKDITIEDTRAIISADGKDMEDTMTDINLESKDIPDDKDQDITDINCSGLSRKLQQGEDILKKQEKGREGKGQSRANPRRRENAELVKRSSWRNTIT